MHGGMNKTIIFHTFVLWVYNYTRFDGGVYIIKFVAGRVGSMTCFLLST